MPQSGNAVKGPAAHRCGNRPPGARNADQSDQSNCQVAETQFPDEVQRNAPFEAEDSLSGEAGLDGLAKGRREKANANRPKNEPFPYKRPVSAMRAKAKRLDKNRCDRKDGSEENDDGDMDISNRFRPPIAETNLTPAGPCIRPASDMRSAGAGPKEWLCFRCRRINNPPHLRNAICGKPALLRVLAHHCLVRGYVDAIDLVVGHVALVPLDLGAEILQDSA